jgi:hypothetical protein
MSSTEYAELAGLRIALTNLKLVDLTYQDQEWYYVTNWLIRRITQLEKMK